VTLDHGCRLLLCLGGENFLLRTRRRIPETDCADPWFLSFAGSPAAYWTLSVNTIIQSAHAVTRQRKTSASWAREARCGTAAIRSWGRWVASDRPKNQFWRQSTERSLTSGPVVSLEAPLRLSPRGYGPEGTSVPSARGRNVPVVRQYFEIGQRARRSAASSAPILEWISARSALRSDREVQ
jgi:hypothetical protein